MIEKKIWDPIREDKIKIYLRQNLLENYLTEDEKKMLKENFPRAEKYLLASERICEMERDYMRYEQQVFAILKNKRIQIKTETKINVVIEEPQNVFKTELKEYIKRQKIYLRYAEHDLHNELIRLENAHKIGEEII